LEVNELNKVNTCSTVEEEKISSALCFWYISTGINVRDHNIKTYFPQREISSLCIMQDIKLMLINMGTTYFLVDQVSIILLYIYTLFHLKVTLGGNCFISTLVR